MRDLKVLSFLDGVLTIAVDGETFSHPIEKLKGWDISIQDFTLELKTFYKVEIKHPRLYSWEGEIIDTTPLPTTFALLNTEGGDVNWSDGISSRSRRPMLLVACKNFIFKFTGKDIPGICVVKNRSFTKAGKWSSNYYELTIAKGFKAIDLREDFSSGFFVNDVTSLAKIAKELGCEDVQPFAVEQFLKSELFGTYKRYLDYLSKVSEMEAFEANEGGEFIPYTFVRECLANRQGDRCLLLNGELFEGVETPEVKIISERYYSGHRGGKTIYELSIHNSIETTELFEYNPYGDDDSLDARGFVRVDGKWVKPVERETEQGERYNPFESLNGMFD